MTNNHTHHYTSLGSLAKVKFVPEGDKTRQGKPVAAYATKNRQTNPGPMPGYMKKWGAKKGLSTPEEVRAAWGAVEQPREYHKGAGGFLDTKGVAGGIPRFMFKMFCTAANLTAGQGIHKVVPYVDDFKSWLDTELAKPRGANFEDDLKAGFRAYLSCRQDIAEEDPMLVRVKFEEADLVRNRHIFLADEFPGARRIEVATRVTGIEVRGTRGTTATALSKWWFNASAVAWAKAVHADLERRAELLAQESVWPTEDPALVETTKEPVPAEFPALTSASSVMHTVPTLAQCLGRAAPGANLRRFQATIRMRLVQARIAAIKDAELPAVRQSSVTSAIKESIPVAEQEIDLDPTEPAREDWDSWKPIGGDYLFPTNSSSAMDVTEIPVLLARLEQFDLADEYAAEEAAEVMTALKSSLPESDQANPTVARVVKQESQSTPPSTRWWMSASQFAPVRLTTKVPVVQRKKVANCRPWAPPSWQPSWAADIREFRIQVVLNYDRIRAARRERKQAAAALKAAKTNPPPLTYSVEEANHGVVYTRLAAMVGDWPRVGPHTSRRVKAEYIHKWSHNQITAPHRLKGSVFNIKKSRKAKKSNAPATVGATMTAGKTAHSFSGTVDQAPIDTAVERPLTPTPGHRGLKQTTIVSNAKGTDQTIESEQITQPTPLDGYCYQLLIPQDIGSNPLVSLVLECMQSSTCKSYGSQFVHVSKVGNKQYHAYLVNTVAWLAKAQQEKTIEYLSTLVLEEPEARLGSGIRRTVTPRITVRTRSDQSSDPTSAMYCYTCQCHMFKRQGNMLLASRVGSTAGEVEFFPSGLMADDVKPQVAPNSTHTGPVFSTASVDMQQGLMMVVVPGVVSQEYHTSTLHTSFDCQRVCAPTHIQPHTVADCQAHCKHTHEGSDDAPQLPSCAENDESYTYPSAWVESLIKAIGCDDEDITTETIVAACRLAKEARATKLSSPRATAQAGLTNQSTQTQPPGTQEPEHTEKYVQANLIPSSLDEIPFQSLLDYVWPQLDFETIVTSTPTEWLRWKCGHHHDDFAAVAVCSQYCGHSTPRTGTESGTVPLPRVHQFPPGPCFNCRGELVCTCESYAGLDSPGLTSLSCDEVNALLTSKSSELAEQTAIAMVADKMSYPAVTVEKDWLGAKHIRATFRGKRVRFPLSKAHGWEWLWKNDAPDEDLLKRMSSRNVRQKDRVRLTPKGILNFFHHSGAVYVSLTDTYTGGPWGHCSREAIASYVKYKWNLSMPQFRKLVRAEEEEGFCLYDPVRPILDSTNVGRADYCYLSLTPKVDVGPAPRAAYWALSVLQSTDSGFTTGWYSFDNVDGLIHIEKHTEQVAGSYHMTPDKLAHLMAVYARYPDNVRVGAQADRSGSDPIIPGKVVTQVRNYENLWNLLAQEPIPGTYGLATRPKEITKFLNGRSAKARNAFWVDAEWNSGANVPSSLSDLHENLESQFSTINGKLPAGSTIAVMTHQNWTHPFPHERKLVLVPHKDKASIDYTDQHSDFIFFNADHFNTKSEYALMRWIPAIYGRPDCTYMVSNCRTEFYDPLVDMRKYVTSKDPIWTTGKGNRPAMENLMYRGASVKPGPFLDIYSRSRDTYGLDVAILHQVGAIVMLQPEAQIIRAMLDAPPVLGAPMRVTDYWPNGMCITWLKYCPEYYMRYGHSAADYTTGRLRERGLAILSYRAPLCDEQPTIGTYSGTVVNKNGKQPTKIGETWRARFALPSIHIPDVVQGQVRKLAKQLNDLAGWRPSRTANQLEELVSVGFNPYPPGAEDVSDALLIVVLGTDGDLNPMMYIARAVASFGVRVHVWYVKKVDHALLKQLEEGTVTNLIFSWLQVLSAGALGYKATLAPLFRPMGKGGSYNLALGPKYVKPLNPTGGFFGNWFSIITALNGQDYRPSPFDDGNLPFSPDGKRVVKPPQFYLDNLKSGRAKRLDGWYAGTDGEQVIPVETRKRLPQLGRLDPIDEQPYVGEYHFPGSATTINAIAGSAGKLVPTTRHIDRNFRERSDGSPLLPTAEEWRERPILPLIVDIEAWGFTTNLTWAERVLSIFQRVANYRSVQYRQWILYLVRVLCFLVATTQLATAPLLWLCSVPLLLHYLIISGFAWQGAKSAFSIIWELPIILYLGWGALPYLMLWVIIDLPSRIGRQIAMTGHTDVKLFLTPTGAATWPFVHMGLWSFKHSTIIEGRFITSDDERLARKHNGPFSISTRTGLPPPGAIVFSVPIRFEVIMASISGAEVKPYSSAHNCQTVIREFVLTSGVVASFVFFLTTTLALGGFSFLEFLIPLIRRAGLKLPGEAGDFFNLAEGGELTASESLLSLLGRLMGTGVAASRNIVSNPGTPTQPREGVEQGENVDIGPPSVITEDVPESGLPSELQQEDVPEPTIEVATEPGPTSPDDTTPVATAEEAASELTHEMKQAIDELNRIVSDTGLSEDVIVRHSIKTEKEYFERLLRSYSIAAAGAIEAGADQEAMINKALDALSEHLQVCFKIPKVKPEWYGEYAYHLGTDFTEWFRNSLEKLIQAIPPALNAIKSPLKWLQSNIADVVDHTAGWIAILIDIGQFLLSASIILAKRVFALADALVDKYLPRHEAARAKSVWALSNLLEKNPYLSAKMRLMSSLVMAKTVDRTTPEADWKAWIDKLREHGAAVGAGHLDEVGGVQFKPVRLGKPMLSHDQASALGYTEDEYEWDPMWEKYVQKLRDEGTPIGFDPVLWGDKNPDAVSESLKRYAPFREDIPTEVREEFKQIGRAIYEEYSSVFKGTVSSIEGVLKYMKDELRPGPPFFSVPAYKTRAIMLADGWDRAIKNMIMEELTLTGEERPGFHYGFIKAQVNKAEKDPRSVLSQAFIQQAKHLMFQGVQSKTYDWHKTGFGMGMPSNHAMVSAFEAVLENISSATGGSLFASDCTKYDSTTGPETYDGLGEIIERSFEGQVGGKEAASHVKARYHQLSNPSSWIIDLTGRGKGREDDNLDLKNVFLPKNQGGGTGEATTTWTNTVGYRINQIAAIRRACNYQPTPKEIISACRLYNTGDDQLGSIAGWFLKKYQLGEEHPSIPGAWRLNEDAFVRLSEAAKHHGLTVNYETVDSIEDAVYLSKSVRKPTDSDMEDIVHWQDTVEASTGIRPPTPERILYHNVANMNLRRQSLPYFKLSGRARVTTAMLPPILPGGVIPPWLDPIEKRKFVKRSGEVDVGNVPSAFIGKIQQTMGHAALMSFNPEYYRNVAEEHVAWYNRVCEMAGFRGPLLPGSNNRAPVAAVGTSPLTGRPLVTYRFDTTGVVLSHRATALQALLLSNRVVSYDKLITNYFKPEKIAPGIKSKTWYKFQHFFDTPHERSAGFLEALDDLYSSIPKSWTKFMKGTGMWNSPTWATSGMIQEVALMRRTGESDITALNQLTKEHPYAVCMDINAAWSRRQLDPEWWETMEAIPVEAFANLQIMTTIIYALLYLVEALIYSIPWIGLGYRILMFGFINFTKTYTIMNNIYWHDKNRSSRSISALIPPDVYMWSKRFSNWVVMQLWMLPYGPAMFAVLPLWWLPAAVATPFEVFAKWLIRGSLSINQDIHPGSKGDNPWDRVAEPVILRAIGEFSPDITKPTENGVVKTQMIGIPAPTGTGKSSWFVKALYDFKQTRSDLKERRIWLGVPRNILRDGFNPPMANQVQKDQVQILKSGVTLQPNSHIVCGTYGHILSRVHEIENGDIILLDEAGEREGAMVALLHKLRTVTPIGKDPLLTSCIVLHLTATPIPLQSLPHPSDTVIVSTEVSDFIQPRFKRRVISLAATPVQRWLAAKEPSPLTEEEQPWVIPDPSASDYAQAIEHNSKADQLVKDRIKAATLRPMFIFTSVRKAKDAADELTGHFRRRVILITREEVNAGRVTREAMEAADCIVGSQILSRGFDDPIGATSTFSDVGMIAQHEGQMRVQLSSPSEHLQRQGRSGRQMDGLDVIHPDAGKGAEPNTYPAAWLLTQEFPRVHDEYNIPSLLDVSKPTLDKNTNDYVFAKPIDPFYPYIGYTPDQRAILTRHLPRISDSNGLFMDTESSVDLIYDGVMLIHHMAHAGVEPRQWKELWQKLRSTSYVVPDEYHAMRKFLTNLGEAKTSKILSFLTYGFMSYILSLPIVSYRLSSDKTLRTVTSPLLPIAGTWRPYGDLSTKFERSLVADPNISISTPLAYYAASTDALTEQIMKIKHKIKNKKRKEKVDREEILESVEALLKQVNSLGEEMRDGDSKPLTSMFPQHHHTIIPISMK